MIIHNVTNKLIGTLLTVSGGNIHYFACSKKFPLLAWSTVNNGVGYSLVRVLTLRLCFFIILCVWLIGDQIKRL